MGRKSIYVNNIDHEVLEKLNQYLHLVSNERLKKMVIAIIMSLVGFTSEEISNVLHISRTTAISYINQWNNNTISFYEKRKGNRKSPITYVIANDISSLLIDRLPDQEGYNTQKWSCSIISDYLEKKHNIKYSKTSVHSLINNLGFEYKYGSYFLVHKKKHNEFLIKIKAIEQTEN